MTVALTEDRRRETEDMLTQLIRRLKPQLARNIPVKQRAVTFWAFICEGRHLAASDVVEGDFRALAHESGLVTDLGRNGTEVVDHLIAWGLQNFNPFDLGPLQ